MDGLHLALFLAATYFGGLTSGLSGFAMGLVVSGVWLHILSPQQSALLIVLCGLVTQGSGIWRVRHAINWWTVWPYIIGGAIGIPIGIALLTTVDPNLIRLCIGVLLLAYSLYSLIRPAFKPPKASFPADLGVGVVNGLISGLTGLGGVAVTVWANARRKKDELRDLSAGAVRNICHDTISFAFAGTLRSKRSLCTRSPVLVAGIWSGFGLYGKLDDAAFRKVILVLLLASGVALIVPMH
jgi:uncharacterized membrane protein YfcA